MKYTGIYKSPKDGRDWLVESFFAPTILPAEFDLTDKMTPVRSQGKEGACAGFASVGVKEYQETTGKDAQPGIKLSPRFIYEEAKKISGHSEGTTLKACMIVCHKLGVCVESLWPYIAKSPGEPNPIAFKDALKYKVKTYARIGNLRDLKQALFDSNIGPSIIGVKVYQGMVTEGAKRTGVVPNPGCWESMKVLGGHALVACAFNDDSPYYKNDGHIKFKNSWGINWGKKGFGYLSYKYIRKNMLDAFSSVDIDDAWKFSPVEIVDLSWGDRRKLWV